MTIEYIFYLILGIATTATEIALVSSYYRIKGEIMRYPLFVVVATLSVIIGGSLLQSFYFLKLIIFLIIYIVLSSFCGKFVSLIPYLTGYVLTIISSFIAYGIFGNGTIEAFISSIILNVSIFYVIQFIEFNVRLSSPIKKVVFIILLLFAVAFSAIYYLLRSV